MSILAMFRKSPRDAPDAAAPDRGGRMRIHYAALENDAAAVRRWLWAGESVDATDNQGFTPLHFAAQQLSLDALRVLVDAKPDATIANQFGNTALWTAVFAANQSPDTGAEIVRLILGLGADPDHKNVAGKTPREMALILGNPTITQLLRN